MVVATLTPRHPVYSNSVSPRTTHTVSAEVVQDSQARTPSSKTDEAVGGPCSQKVRLVAGSQSLSLLEQLCSIAVYFSP